MHRDIDWRNILYFHGDNGEKPQAVLADFGKFKVSSDLGIGNRCSLPPEIMLDGSDEYTQSIDLWMLAYAIILTFWPKARDLGTPWVGRNWQKIIEELYTSESYSVGLRNILWGMFMPSPEKRLTATEAIERSEFKFYLTDEAWEYANRRRYRKSN